MTFRFLNEAPRGKPRGIKRNSPKPPVLRSASFGGFSAPSSPQQAAEYSATENKKPRIKASTRTAGLSIPRTCFYCRYADRIRRRGPMNLFDRACAECGKGIKTNYAPERPEIVYCEACYQSEVV